MKISQEAMQSALSDLQTLRYTPQLVSMYESYLVAKWCQANEKGDLVIRDVDEAVSALFVLDPENPVGRLYPFRYEWKTPRQSGRKTVWDNTTRAAKLATTIFNDIGKGRGDIRGGLRSDAAKILGDTLEQYQVRLPKWESLACLVLRNYEFDEDANWLSAQTELLDSLAMNIEELTQISAASSLDVPLLSEPEWNFSNLSRSLLPTKTSTPTIGNNRERTREENIETSDYYIYDERVWNMLKGAVANYKFIILVGPPGTGKSKLIERLCRDVNEHPQSYGLPEGFDPDPAWHTPDESWSAFELLGGYAPNEKGTLEWAPGLIMNALSDNRWLVLDETNRADMDKIMGPTISWLSGQTIEVGRTRPHDGESIELGWTSLATNKIESAAKADATVKYLAGSSWRMMGTYNPQDALRVFRFGQALSRRFVVVPIPAISPGEFDNLLSNQPGNIKEEIFDAICGLYSAHYEHKDTVLGPAVFLRMARYCGESNSQLGTNKEELLGDNIVESYVLNVGKYLALYGDDLLNSLGDRIISQELIIGVEQWRWITSQIEVLI